MLAANHYASVAVLVVAAIGTTVLTVVLAHVIGPRRHGPVKDDTYESGMTPAMSARRRFHVRFYLVAVMYLILGVEIVFLYPWAVTFAALQSGFNGSEGAQADLTSQWSRAMAESGYGSGFVLGAMLVFFVLLAVGLAYEWRRGVFRWD